MNNLKEPDDKNLVNTKKTEDMKQTITDNIINNSQIKKDSAQEEYEASQASEESQESEAEPSQESEASQAEESQAEESEASEDSKASEAETEASPVVLTPQKKETEHVYLKPSNNDNLSSKKIDGLLIDINYNKIINNRFVIPTVAENDTIGIIDLPKLFKDSIICKYADIEKRNTMYKEKYIKNTNTYHISIQIPLNWRSYLNLYISGQYEREYITYYCRIKEILPSVIIYPISWSRHRIKNHAFKLPNTKLEIITPSIVRMFSVDKLNNLATNPVEVIEKKIERDDILKYSKGDHLIVKELQHYHIVHKEDFLEQSSFSNFFQPIIDLLYKESQDGNLSIKQKLKSISWDEYIGHSEKYGIVAETSVRNIFKEFLACALFEKKNVNNNKLYPSPHIEIITFCVDYKCDEDIIDKIIDSKIDDDEYLSSGIKNDFFVNSCTKVLNKFGQLDIIYQGKDKSVIELLYDYGFTRIGKIMYKKNNDMKCESWKDCLKVVREKFPDYLLSERLKIAKTIYKKERISRPRLFQKKSKRIVNIKSGIQILTEYYQLKYIENENIDPTINFKKEWESLSVFEKKCILQYTNAIRKHLLRYYKRDSQSYLDPHKSPNITWKFRPNPNIKITKDSITGPDIKYLVGLDVDNRAGLLLFKNPLGKFTPELLVWTKSPHDWKVVQLNTIEKRYKKTYKKINKDTSEKINEEFSEVITE